MNRVKAVIFIVMLVLPHHNVIAQEYQLSIQPILSESEVLTSYQPLADYLTEKTGHKITIKTYRNFFTYWQKMKQLKEFDLVLDAAHFTDYRIKNSDYTVLVKLPYTVSFSLVTHEDLLIFEPEELILKNIATMPSPGLGGVRLYEIFNNPARLPREVTVNNSSEAVDAIAEGKVDAAIIPSPLVNKYDFLNTVMTTDSVPHMALSASPAVPLVVRQNILNVLSNAHKSIDGKAMLKRIGLTEFVGTSAKEYSGYSTLLKDVFGYTASVAQAGPVKK